MRKRFKKRERREALDIDITSLLDVLVILLVFLLKSYNPAELKLDLAKNIELPPSKSIDYGSQQVMVQVNVDREIFVNSERIGVLNGSGEQIPVLFEELTKLKKEEETRAVANANEGLSEEELKRIQDKKNNINIILDQSLDYGVLRKVMHTAAVAGYPKFKFIVQGRYQ